MIRYRNILLVAMILSALTGLARSQHVFPVAPTDPSLVSLRRAMAERHLHWKLTIGFTGENYCLEVWTSSDWFSRWEDVECDKKLEVISKEVTDYYDQLGRPKEAWSIDSRKSLPK